SCNRSSRAPRPRTCRRSRARGPTLSLTIDRLRRDLDNIAEANVVLPGFEAHGKAPQAAQVGADLGGGFRQRPAAATLMAQCKRAIAVAIEPDDLHVGHAHLLRVLLREELAHSAVAAFVVNAVDEQRVFVRVI